MTEAFNSPDSWTRAKRYAGIFGEVPSSFSSVIRTLISDHAKGAGLSSNASFLASRLLLGPSMKSPFYFASLTFHSEHINATRTLSPKQLALVFPPYDTAVIFGLTFLFRRIKREGQENEVQWPTIEAGIIRDVDIGGAIGDAIPRIGRSAGMIVGAVHWLALGAMLHADKTGVREYLRHLKATKKSFDPSWEMARWGCTTAQVGSLMMQSVGFGIDFASSLAAGLTPGSSVDEAGAPEIYRAYITRIWIDSFSATGQVPDIRHSGNYYPLKAALAQLIYEVSVIRSTGFKLGWLGKTKGDINPIATPQLFDGGSKAPQQSSAPKASSPPSLKDFPPEVLELFSKEELQEMSEAELEELLRAAREL